MKSKLYKISLRTAKLTAPETHGFSSTFLHRYKRKAKGREAERKLRKEAKKSKANGTYQKKLKKDPGIPNLWPFKYPR